MKVFQLQDDWSIDNLTLTERPQPEPGPGQVLVKRYYGGKPGWNGGHDAPNFAACHHTRNRSDLCFRRTQTSPRLPGARPSFWEDLYSPLTPAFRLSGFPANILVGPSSPSNNE